MKQLFMKLFWMKLFWWNNFWLKYFLMKQFWWNDFWWNIYLTKHFFWIFSHFRLASRRPLDVCIEWRPFVKRILIKTIGRRSRYFIDEKSLIKVSRIKLKTGLYQIQREITNTIISHLAILSLSVLTIWYYIILGSELGDHYGEVKKSSRNKKNIWELLFFSRTAFLRLKECNWNIFRRCHSILSPRYDYQDAWIHFLPFNNNIYFKNTISFKGSENEIDGTI